MAVSFEVEIPAKPIWCGKRFNVMAGSFRHEDGEHVIREWIDPGNVVAVLPFDGTYFWLGRQPREATGGYQLGLCAGKIDPGEDPLTAAKRELLEEFGFESNFWLDWGTFYSSEGITNEQCTLFMAGGISRYDTSQLDAAERVDVVKVPLQYLEEAITNVTNAKAKIALLKLWQREAKKSAQCIYNNIDAAADEASWLAGRHLDGQVEPEFDWESLR